MQTQMSPDDAVWEQTEETADNWLYQFLEIDILRPIADFILILQNKKSKNQDIQNQITEHPSYHHALHVIA